MKRGFLLSLVAAVALVAIVHFFVLTLVTIPGKGEEPVLLHGDRVAVNRWAYGFRTPFISQWGYHRWYKRPLTRGEWVAYNASVPGKATCPDSMRLCVGRCLALPGDTVWVGTKGKVSASRNYASGQIWPVVVPAKGSYVKATPWNVHLYASTINGLEGGKVTIENDSLCVKGKKVAYYCFSRDYYWMASSNEQNLNDSRTMGFIPETHLVGRVERVIYSLDGYKPRWNRFCKPRL